MIFNQQII